MVERVLPERERLLVQTVARLQSDLDRVREAAWTHSVIDTAAGLLAGREGCSVDLARERLLTESRRTGTDALTVAARVIDTAIDGPPPPAPAQRHAAAPRRTLGEYHRALAACTMAIRADELCGHLAAAVAALTGPVSVILTVGEPSGDLQMRAAVGVPAHVLHRFDRFRRDSDTPPAAAARGTEPLWLTDVDVARRRFTLLDRTEARWTARVWFPVRVGAAKAVVGLLWHDERVGLTPSTRALVHRAAALAGRVLLTLHPDPEADAVRRVQSILDVVPGSVALLNPIRDGQGTLVDWVFAAASPDSIDVAGRTGPDIVGRRASELYPTIVGTETWTTMHRAYETGAPTDVGPFEYEDVLPHRPRVTRYSTRLRRLGNGLLASWQALDRAERLTTRLARTERLGNLGWGSWRADDGQVEWSAQLYSIVDRDPEEGPPDHSTYLDFVHPEDRPIAEAGRVAMLSMEGRYDLEYRLLLPSGVRRVRAVAETIFDGDGRPAEIFGLVQDITEQWQSHERLRTTRLELELQQELLAEEHLLAGQLRQIILPVPEKPLELPGLRVTIRCMPTEHKSNVGGDWCHATRLTDGAVLLAVGDVAGHGLPAASVMAQLRYALIGLGTVLPDPADLLGALNAMLCDQVTEQTLATAVVARFEPASRELTWAQAGHLPCLLLRDGTARPMERPEGMVLGATTGLAYGTARTTLEPGDLLLFYTDGLVEGPDLTAEAGVDRLMRALPRLVSGGGLHTLVPANPDDDTCLLAAEVLAAQPSGPPAT